MADAANMDLVSLKFGGRARRSTAALREWERAAPAARPQRICAVSSGAEREEEAKAAGVDRFLAKPVPAARAEISPVGVPGVCDGLQGDVASIAARSRSKTGFVELRRSCPSAF